VSEEREELDLLAFRYVAGELAAAEAAAFEVRLADDQSAREAVSRAVAVAQRLVEAAPAAAPVVSSKTKRDVWMSLVRPLGWMVAGAAVALLAVTLGRAPGPLSEGQPESRGPAVSPHRPMADAVVWARLHADQNWATADLERWAEEPATSTTEAHDWSDSAGVPSWVLTAKPKSEK
jgi:hypothetical protein